MIDERVLARAARDTWDALASDYARLLPDMSAEAPLDRAVLNAFVEMVKQSGDGLVADVGCGSGRVTAHLADAGLQIFGLDLSIGMVNEARAARRDLAFVAAHASALPLLSGALGGLLAWYSLINLPTDLLPAVLAEFARVMRPESPVLVAFQSGDGERVHRATAYGQPIPITYYRHRIEDVTDALAAAGFALHATVRRERSQAHESTPQALVLAQR